jgi:hypothetical protein
MTVNRKMFAEIHALITEFPELHHQGSWEANPHYRNTCGTTRCIAGWATWLAAKEHGLLSRKRDMLNTGMLQQLAEVFNLSDAENDANDYLSVYPVAFHPVIGAHVLGLTDSQAQSLFFDFDHERAVARVWSFAKTGHDLSEDEMASYF